MGASEQDVQHLTAGYGTQELDASGEYQWNRPPVESHDMTGNKNGTPCHGAHGIRGDRDLLPADIGLCLPANWLFGLL